MSLNLLVVAKRERIESLMPLLNVNGTEATFFLGGTTSSILRCLRSHPEKDQLIVFDDVLGNINSFLRRFRNVRGIRLVVIAGVNDDLTMVRELCQKFEASDYLYRALFVYKPKNFGPLIRKIVIKMPAVSFQNKKKKTRWLNGRMLTLGTRVAMVFDIIVKAEGRFVLWRDLRQYFNERATMRDAVYRLCHAINTQYPEAKRAFVVRKAVGVMFKPSLLL